MNQDEFESRLQRTPLKQIPGEWRDEILAAAFTVAVDIDRRITPIRAPAFTATWPRHLRELFWPHPIAWSALAAIWLMIAVAQFAIREPAPATTPVYVAKSPGAPTVMELQRELLTAWSEPLAKPKNTREAPLPPQSCIERRRNFYAV